jgi:acylpyruvate hydrolase
VNVHYEVELAVIMGKSAHNIKHAKETMPPEEYDKLWQNAIFGYAIGIDLTARNLQDEAKKAGLPWTSAKGFRIE